MKAVIAGCGVMGKAHGNAYRARGVELAAVCDADGDRAEKLATEFNCRYYESFPDMLRQEKPDLASICTPAFHHAQGIKEASQAHCAVLCEKPFAQSLQEAKQAAQWVEKERIPFRLGFKMRYEAGYATAKRILESGEIGALNYVFISHFQPLSQPAWYMDRGVIAELLVHSCDLACWFFGEEPLSVWARMEYRMHKEGEDQALLELDFSESKKAVICGGYMEQFPPVRGKHDFVFQLVGEKGYVAGKRNGCLEVLSPNRIETLSLEEQNAFEREIADFLLAAKGKPAGGADLKAALLSQKILESAALSARRGIPQGLIPLT